MTEHLPTAGITPIDFGDLPAYSPPYSTPANELSFEYNHAHSTFRREGFTGKTLDTWDDRLPFVMIGSQDFVRPNYEFLITEPWLENLSQLPPDLSRNDFLRMALAHGEDAVNPDFTADAANAINSLYYSSAAAFTQEAKLATLYAKNELVNRALGAALVANTFPGKLLRVKELGSGAHTEHWNWLAASAVHHGATGIDLTITDFTERPTPSSGSSDIRFSSELYSLFDDMPDLPADRRYDAIVTTYGFDSVWQPEDISLHYDDGKWYQNLYRTKIADWNPRKDELLAAMRTSTPLPDASPTDLEGITLEKAHTPISLDNHPFARYIAESDNPTINFPGGLIKRVVNAFETQLNDTGTFINGDVAYFGNPKSHISGRPMTSGVAARYKIEDYTIAKKILEREYGLNVALYSLGNFIKAHLSEPDIPDNPETQRLFKSVSNGVMVVKR